MRFQPRPEALYEVKTTEKAASALLTIAEAAEVVARDTAHVLSGAYRDAMRVTVSKTPVGFEGILYNIDYKANWLERGTGPPVPTPPYHTLYNALRAIGLLTFEV